MTDELFDWENRKAVAVTTPEVKTLPPLSEFVLSNLDEAATTLGMMDKEKNKNYLKELIEHEKKNPSGNLFKVIIRTREDLLRPLVNEMQDYQIMPDSDPTKPTSIWEVFSKARMKYIKDPSLPVDLIDVMMGTIMAEKSWVIINQMDNINVVVADLLAAFSPGVTTLEQTAILQLEIEKLKKENENLSTMTDRGTILKSIDESSDKLFLEEIKLHLEMRAKEIKIAEGIKN